MNRINSHLYDTQINAAGRSLRACVARKSKAGPSQSGGRWRENTRGDKRLARVPGRGGRCGVATRLVSPIYAVDSAGTAPIKTFDPRAALPKGGINSQTARTFIDAFLFFSQRLRSIREVVFPAGFVPSHEISAQASHWRVLRREWKRPWAAK